LASLAKLKATKIAQLFLLIYSISASAKALSLLGDQ